MTYTLFPIDFPPAAQGVAAVTPKEAAKYCAQFVQLVPQRISMLAQLTDIDWAYSLKTMDRSGVSFGNFCAWVDSMDIWSLVEGHAKQETMVVLDNRHRAVLEQVAGESRGVTGWEFTPVGVSVVTDVGILFGEFIRVRVPWTAWTYEDRKNNLFYGQPCVGWFGGRLNRSVLVRQFASVAMTRAREKNVSLAVELRPMIEARLEEGRTVGARVRWTR
jgi:hypothetical protein